MRDLTPPDEFVGEVPQGVGAALSINGRTRAMDRFFGNLPPNYGVPIDPLTAHATFLYSDETAIPIHSERDLIALQKAGQSINKLLGGLPLQEMVLHPEGDELEKFGRYLGVPLRATPFMTRLREDLVEIIVDELGVKVDPDISFHMSVARPRRTRVKTRDNLPPFPANMHVNGYDIQRRVMTKGHQKSPKPKYVNTGRRSGSRSVD